VAATIGLLPTNSNLEEAGRVKTDGTVGHPAPHSRPPVCRLQPPKAVKSDASALPEALRARNPYLHSTVAVEPWSLASVWPLSFCQLFTALSRFTARTDAGIPVESRFCLGPRGRLEEKKQREPWKLEPGTDYGRAFPSPLALHGRFLMSQAEEQPHQRGPL
jgi:hypothetical protein